ncbi:hypothetical protein [Enterococcus faecalis]|uniref:hypothetical protein n=1 Tax=Enterococcus faecalis TaxID=1351 RepID=UPI0008786F54|nr:hypothetical protein [Enterococcus faecalis]EKZ0433771.1 hypothetical protein [Enterococcus faecalis]MCA6711253.1 hypothetical protein [Enterococcus faecalis]MCA6730101.1 hypothetical protein [Enterococcus faecalis]MCU9795344.1 hypothetical protein [Enterococcus faecalis]OFA10739.1 hypothetical protein ENFAE_25580 [Enterococcus faecalis]
MKELVGNKCYQNKKNFHVIALLCFYYGIWLIWFVLLCLFIKYDSKINVTHWQTELFRWFSLGIVVVSLLYHCFSNNSNQQDKLIPYLYKLFLTGLAIKFLYLSIDTISWNGKEIPFSFLINGHFYFGDSRTMQYIFICQFFLFIFVQKLSCEHLVYHLMFNEKEEGVA